MRTFAGLLRFAQLITMVIWVGGLIFFAFVLAPVAFHTLPTIQLAGQVVGQSLRVFDVIALVAAALFLGATALLFRQAAPRIRGRYEMEFLLAAVMLLGTAFIHWGILPPMDADRAQAGGDIAQAAPDSPVRRHFDKLHTRSERIEGGVLLIGLAVLFLMSREQIELVPAEAESHQKP